MSRIDLHQTAIAILEAIRLAKSLRTIKLENVITAQKYSLWEYKDKCIKDFKMSDRVIARLESRYTKHLKKIGA